MAIFLVVKKRNDSQDARQSDELRKHLKFWHQKNSSKGKKINNFFQNQQKWDNSKKNQEKWNSVSFSSIEILNTQSIRMKKVFENLENKDGKLIFAEFSIKMSCVRVYFFSNSKLVITFVSLCLFWLDDYYWNGYLKIEIGWEHKHNAQLHCFNSERKNCQPPQPRSFSFLNAFQSVHWSDNLTLTIRM